MELIDLANCFIVQAAFRFHIPKQLANPLTDCFDESVHLARKKYADRQFYFVCVCCGGACTCVFEIESLYTALSALEHTL